MIVDIKNPPRCFSVGNSVRFEMRDCGSIALSPDEQVTFLTPTGGEFDVARKDWGFYATPSLNGRLPQFGLRATLVRNTMTGRYFILLVEQNKEPEFHAYLAQESCEVVCWLDTTDALDGLRSALAAKTET